MPDPVVIVAPDAAATAALLGVLPEATAAEVVLVGPPSEASATATLPVTRVTVFDGTPGAAEADVVGPAIADLLPTRGLVVLDSTQPSRDLAGWLAATADAPVVWGAERIDATADGWEVHRGVLGGSHRMVHRIEGDGLAAVIARPVGSPSGIASLADREAPVRRVPVDQSRSRVRILDAASTGADGHAPLGSARVVVSVGRGIGGPENVPLFAALAERLGAALGASRVAVDEGWLPFAHQVGQTGTAVAPDVYLAFGISGAIQHVAGMRSSRRVVAVNIDPDAPLCRGADIIVHADAVAFASALLDHLENGKDRCA